MLNLAFSSMETGLVVPITSNAASSPPSSVSVLAADDTVLKDDSSGINGRITFSNRSSRTINMPKQLNITLHDITKNNIKELKRINAACFPTQIKYSDSFYRQIIWDSSTTTNDDITSPNLPSWNQLAYYRDQVVGAVCAAYAKDETSPKSSLSRMKMRQRAANDEEQNNDTKSSVEGGHQNTFKPAQNEYHPVSEGGCQTTRSNRVANSGDDSSTDEAGSVVSSNSSNSKDDDCQLSTNAAISVPLPRLYIMTLAVLAPYRGRGIGSQLLRHILENCQQRGIMEIALHVQISNHDAIRLYENRFGFRRGELVKNYYKRLEPPHCYVLYKKLPFASSYHRIESDSSDFASNPSTLCGSNTSEEGC